MTIHSDSNQSIAVIGAGPAGLFAAKKLAASGHTVALLNRDIKPGGLAEYGIYHDKHKMKNGLRKQFRKLLQDPNIHYFGNISISDDDELSIDDIQDFGFDAVLVTVGAQGTKWLGLPGEDLEGVYHAKDLVYHYNQLPPFGEKEFPIGNRVICIGVGNVMLDIAHWAIRDLLVDSVTAIARRGPSNVKFSKKEMALVIDNLNQANLDKEIERSRPAMENINQSPEEAKAFILSALDKAEKTDSDTEFNLNFLQSPKQIIGENGKVTGIEVEDMTLGFRDSGKSKAIPMGTSQVLEADTIVFCIGDRVDKNFGLPLDKWQEFAKNPNPRFPINEISFEVHNADDPSSVENIFLAGWAREASSGLVGSARKDGESAAAAIQQYLDTLPDDDREISILDNLKTHLNELDKPIVTKIDWEILDAVEQKIAEEEDLPVYVFGSNEEMLEVIDGQKINH
ncbi:MAG: FAD-dependent oxidoreductase [Chloroflexota bacterium]